VNPLNQAQVLEDIYVSGLNTGTTDRGFANIKKFKFRGGLIVGRGKEPGANALDSSGLLIAQVPDFWSPDSNASSSEASPVTSRIASGSEPRRRNVYTYIGEDSHPNKPVPLSQHPFVAENSAISAGPASLDLGAGDPDRDQLINWVRGDLATIKYPDLIWSAPAHSRPTPVVYASESKNDSERLSDAVVYAATNDGSIHAIDANTGKELWAYIPQELFSSLKMLFTDNTKPATRY
jgi:type IV pilus assembly protein PilY1